MKSRVRNQHFDRDENFVLGRSRLWFVLWYPVKVVFFLSSIPWPSALKSAIIRAFGGRVGLNVYWKPRVNVHIPWKLSVGENTWIGEEVCIVNFESVSIGANCCLSQRVFLCSGSHDYRSERMRYRNEPVHIGDGAWIGAMCFVAPGTRVGVDVVVCAGTVAKGDLAPFSVYGGSPVKKLRERWIDG